MGGGGEPDALQQLARSLFRGRARDAVEHRLQPHQLGPRHQWVDGGILQCDADRATHHRCLRDHVVPRDPRPPAGRLQQRRQHAHCRRLAGAVRTEEPEDLTLADCEVNALDGSHLAERAHQPFGFDRILGQARAVWIARHTRSAVAGMST